MRKLLILAILFTGIVGFAPKKKQIPTFKIGINGERVYSEWTPFKRSVPKKYVVPFKRFK